MISSNEFGCSLDFRNPDLSHLFVLYIVALFFCRGRVFYNSVIGVVMHIPHLVLHLAQAAAGCSSDPEYWQYKTEYKTKEQSEEEDLNNILEHSLQR